MDRQRNVHEIPLINELDPEQVLTSWLNAVAGFHFNYNEIHNFVQAHAMAGKKNTKARVSMNQCSISQLKVFLDEMLQHLEALLTDIGASGQSLKQANYQKLAAHTSALELLNKQAQQLLVLTILPAS